MHLKIRNPCTSTILLNFIQGIKHIFKYLLGLEEDELQGNESLLPQHDKNGNKQIEAQYKRIYCEQHLLNGRVFLSLTDENGSPALQVTNMNDTRQVMFIMQGPKQQNGTNGHIQTKNGHSTTDSIKSNGLTNGHTNEHKTVPNENVSLQVFEVVPASKPRRTNGGKLDQELWKLAVAIIYVVIVHFIATYCILIAQERLPDKTRYRPLPDMILDRVPYLPWAYRVTEGIIYSLFVILATMMFFHKNRFVVLRRGLFICGTIYLFRSLCICMTSLPMPQAKYDCDRLIFKNSWDRFKRAVVVYLGMGMKVTGMKTCGDYMFSGHTCIITVLIYVINHYSPRRWVLLHIFVWILGLTGIVFIFLSHGHYSIDVIIAFFIVSRMFFTHHVIADNMDLIKRRHGLMRTRLPILFLMEGNNRGIVPNEFEWPLPPFSRIKRYFRGKSLTDYIIQEI